MREPSASLLALAEKCQHPFTSGTRWPFEEQSTFGMFGDRVHVGCEMLTVGGEDMPLPDPSLSEAEIKRADRCIAQARVYLEPYDQGERFAELELRYHVENGTARREERGARRLPGEWTARVDLVIVHPSFVHVVDWKTGRQENTEPAASNLQLRLSALAAARVFGKRRASAALVHLDEDGYGVDSVMFDAFDLASAAEDFRALRAKLTVGPTPPVPGPWCTQLYCKLRGICPATQAALAAAYPLEHPMTPSIRDDAHARWTLERLPGAKAALDKIEEAVREYAKRKPVPLADGKVYGWREKTRRTVHLEAPGAVDALKGVLHEASQFAIKTETSATIDSIEEAARLLTGGGRAKGAIVRDALAALEACGGLEVSTYKKPEIFKPAKGDETTC